MIPFIANAIKLGFNIAPHLVNITKAILTQYNASIVDKACNDHVKACSTAFAAKCKSICRDLGEDIEPETQTYLSKVRDGTIVNVDKLSKAMRRDVEVVLQTVYQRTLKGLSAEVFSGEVMDMNAVMMIEGLKSYISPSINIGGVTSGELCYPPVSVVERSFLRLLDDAFLAMSRMRPGRVLAPSGSLVLQGVTQFTTVIPKGVLDAVQDRYETFYHIASYRLGTGGRGSKSPQIVTFIPRMQHLSDREFSAVTGFAQNSLPTMTVYDLLSRQSSALPGDPNFSGCRILDKVLGSSQTSLSLVLEFLAIFGAKFYHNDSDLYRASFQRKGLDDMMRFTQVDRLREVVMESSISLDTLTQVHASVFDQMELMRHLLFNANIGREALSEFLSMDPRFVANAIGVYAPITTTVPMVGYPLDVRPTPSPPLSANPGVASTSNAAPIPSYPPYYIPESLRESPRNSKGPSGNFWKTNME